MATPLKPMTPTDARESFDQRVTLSPAEFKKIDAELKQLAFTVSRENKMQVIEETRDLISTALKNGESLGTFRRKYKERMAIRGWTGRDPWHVDTIYLNNVHGSYNTGRFDTMIQRKKEFPKWRFVIVDDTRLTDICRQLKGVIRPSNDPIFSQYYPQNHHRCRTKVVPISRFDRRKTTDLRKKKIDVPAQDGFNKNAAAKGGTYQPDLKKYDPKLQKAFKKDVKQTQKERGNFPREIV